MKPYKAIINVNFSVFPVDVTGEASGQLLSRKELRESNLHPFVIEVKGETKEECLSSLTKKLERLKSND